MDTISIIKSVMYLDHNKPECQLSTFVNDDEYIIEKWRKSWIIKPWPMEIWIDMGSFATNGIISYYHETI